MTKIIVLAFVIITALSNQVFAKETFTKDTTPLEKIRKHEIGASFSPALVIMLGGSPGYYNRFAVTYRKNKSEHYSLRIAASVTSYYEPYYFWNNNNPIHETDSTVTYYMTGGNKNPKWQLNFGYEYNWGKRKVKWYTGGDLFYAYSSTYGHSSTIRYRKDSIINGNMNIHLDSVLNHFSSLRINHHLGFSPLIGLKFPISKRFYISAQFHINLGLQFGGRREEYSNNTFTVYHDKYINFEVDSPGIISDLSLVFRF